MAQWRVRYRNPIVLTTGRARPSASTDVLDLACTTCANHHARVSCVGNGWSNQVLSAASPSQLAHVESASWSVQHCFCSICTERNVCFDKHPWSLAPASGTPHSPILLQYLTESFQPFQHCVIA
jgi:hypothetical protein